MSNIRFADQGLLPAFLASVESADAASDRLARNYPRTRQLVEALTREQMMRARVWWREGVSLALIAWRLKCRPETVTRTLPEILRP